ncbi:cytochrome P460 family protein [Terriglobus roseus]|uniref:Cytochrome P460 n=1 Tax=Terriglobus roseus TaxID=392734 RepID=A0A1H4U8R2_9BACT|nr:cytochrome P460 family protein [Terriglobus roseus]SEC64828.1 Cytochrome P460 [Terriglobus roseus]
MLKTIAVAVTVSTLLIAAVAAHPVKAADKPAAPATMAVPADYREWIFLTSGMDMTYAQAGAVGLTADKKSVFDNVFVNPEAYKVYKQTGTWPDKTTMILENRIGEPNVSINKGGRTQGHDVSGLEIHAKINNEWVFYIRGKDGEERLIPKPASCYTCHEEHAASDTTFVQFYPTLLPIAQAKKSLSAAYLKDMASTDGSGAGTTPAVPAAK